MKSPFWTRKLFTGGFSLSSFSEIHLEKFIGGANIADGKMRFSSLPKLIRPSKPLSEECCNSDCEVCVNDMYEKHMEEYRQELLKRRDLLKIRLSAAEEEFLSSYSTPNSADSRRNISLAAFEKLENELNGGPGTKE
jgi:hypothetical protein